MNTSSIAERTSGSITGSGRPLVLLAEDDAIQRIALGRLFERAGFEVIATDDGAGAIELAEAHLPDLVVLDAVMPIVGGFETIAALRASPALATTPAIILSGLDDLGSRLRAFSIGADDFVTKPVDRDELIARARAQLRIVDTWRVRVDNTVGDLRSIRRQISDTRRATDPIEAARALTPHFPSALGCSSLLVLDAGGRTTWVDEPFAPDSLADDDVASVPTAHGSTILPSDTIDRCPLCGSDASSSIVAASAGSWDTGRAILVVGCLDRSTPGRRLLAEEVADASRVVLSERLRDSELDPELSVWLDEVIDRKAFHLVFQPIVDIGSGRVVAQEALARFEDGTSPGEVFGVANPTERHVRLELALVEAALAEAAALPESVRIHVNVSPATAGAAKLAELVAGSGRRVVLEITEHALFTSTNVAELRDVMPATCLLAADDVGAGYAGLAQLLDYRPDVLKIDRTVVTDVDVDPARQALVAGLVQFARATNSRVVAEGVERIEECQTLQQLGIELGQGYLFARPTPLGETARIG